MRKLRIPFRHARPVLYRRYRNSEFVDGIWEDGRFEDEVIWLNAQPASPNVVRRLPEGNSGNKVLEVYSNVKLDPGEDGKRKPCEIQLDGTWYVLSEINDWSHRGFNHAVFVEKKEL